MSLGGVIVSLGAVVGVECRGCDTCIGMGKDGIVGAMVTEMDLELETAVWSV